MLSPSSLFSKIIGVLARNGGGKWNQIVVVLAVCRSWTWHLFAFVSGWGHLISSFFASMGLVNLFWPLSFSLCHVIMTSDPLMSNTTKSSVVLLICSREFFLCSFQPPSDSLLVLIHKHHIPLSCVDDVGNIMALLWLSHFLSTSAHYPGIWSRDSLPVPWSLHASMAGSSHST